MYINFLFDSACEILFRDLLPMEPSAIQDNGVKSVVEEEEEGLWVDEDKSEGELGDDSDDPVEQAFSKTEGKDRGCEQFGPREEKRCYRFRICILTVIERQRFCLDPVSAAVIL